MRISLPIVVFAALASTLPVAGQDPPDTDPGRPERTRADLEGLLQYYDEVLESPAYSDNVKERVRRDAEQVRTRLQQGDFRLGDRIALYVEGEPELPDTVAVQAGPSLALPLFGDISLRGVLRSEIETHLTEELGRFIRDPTVRAKGLMRVSVQGAVGAPGFYVIPADMLVGETLMVAGGPAANANLNELRVERGGERVLGGQELQEAMQQGLTLDQLNLQAGDQFVMPERGQGFFNNIGVIAGLITTLSFAIFQIVN